MLPKDYNFSTILSKIPWGSEYCSAVAELAKASVYGRLSYLKVEGLNTGGGLYQKVSMIKFVPLRIDGTSL